MLLNNLDKRISPCSDIKYAQKEEEAQNEMPDSTTNTEKNNASPFHCGDDVLLPNKDGKYYLGMLVCFVRWLSSITMGRRFVGRTLMRLAQNHGK